MSMALQYGKVIAHIVELHGDAADADEHPDVVGATGVTVTFTPKMTTFISAEKQIINHKPVICTVDEQGIMRDSQGLDGIWLLVGNYTAKFSGGHFSDITFTLDANHTAEAPLNLADAVPYTPPPAVVVNAVELPSGTADGQVLTWMSGSATWATPDSVYHVGDTPPADTSQIWIDTSGG